MIITSQNNVPISNYGGGFRCKNEYPWCIIEVKSIHFPIVFKNIEKNKKKSDGKTGIFTQNQFSTKSIFLYGCNSKTNHCKYLKFSPNVYVIKFSKMFDFFRFKFLRNLSKTRKFATFEIQILTKICQILEYLQIIFVENLIQELKCWCIPAIKT
ncbi:Uncharacterized protein FWK35_00007090, partial [Aphis craccivora]